MPEVRREPTLFAGTAGPLGALTEQCLAEPEGESLLADPRRSLEEQAGGECTARDEVAESPAERRMAEERNEGHE